MVSKQRKAELVKKFGRNAKDTGYAPVQIAILTEEIEDLKVHFANNKRSSFNARFYC